MEASRPLCPVPGHGTGLAATRQAAIPGKRSKQGLLGLIEDNRQGPPPLILPLT